MIPLNANTIMQLNILAQLLAGAKGLANPQKAIPMGLVGPRPMLINKQISYTTPAIEYVAKMNGATPYAKTIISVLAGVGIIALVYINMVPMFPSSPVVEYDDDDPEDVPILTSTESLLKTATEKEMDSMPMPTDIDIPGPESDMTMAVDVQPANTFEHDEIDLGFEEAINEAFGTPLEASFEEPFKEAAKTPLIDQDESDLGMEEPLTEASVTPLEASIGGPVEDLIEQKAPTLEVYPDDEKTVQRESPSEDSKPSDNIGHGPVETDSSLEFQYNEDMKMWIPVKSLQGFQTTTTTELEISNHGTPDGTIYRADGPATVSSHPPSREHPTFGASLDSESSEALNNAINENHAKITVANYEYFESWTYATTIEYGNTAPYTSVAVPGRGYSVDDLNTVPIVDDMDQPSPYQPSPSRVVQDMTATMLTRPVITTVRVVKKPSVQVSKTTTLERSHPELSHNVHSSGARRAAIKWFAIRIPLHHFGTVYHMLGPVIVFTISYYFWEDMLMACMLGKCSVLGRLRI